MSDTDLKLGRDAQMFARANEVLRAENERLRQELDHARALRQDAERYRWLRNDALQVLVEGPIVVLADKWGGLVAQDNGSHISIDGETLDKNIDAAMKATGSPADGGRAMSDVQMTHSTDCWRWHHECAKRAVEELAIDKERFRTENERLRSELGVANDCIELMRQDAERYRFQRESDWRYRVEHYGASEDERDAYITEYDANYDAAMKEKNNES